MKIGNHLTRLFLGTLILMAGTVAMFGGAARAATPSCSIKIPPLRPQADGTGTVTGHVTGSCSFAWHSQNRIQFKDRWHSMGVEDHAGGPAGQYVSQPIDRDDYHGDGYWREVVIVYNAANKFMFRIVGPVSEFAS